MNKEIARIGIVTVSDRASRGEYEDKSGPAVQEWLTKALATQWQAVIRLVADERGAIELILKELCDQQKCCLVITTGGTGPAPRDITPEATEAVCDKLLDGFGEQMRAVSLQHVPTAILSRQLAAIRGHSLLINLPGNPAAIAACLAAVFAAVPCCIDLIGGPYLDTNPDMIRTFRPGCT